MSSNIEIQKICQHCGELYTARKTTTKYCSLVCSQRNYKKRKRDEKIEKVNIQTQTILNRPIEKIKEKEFLTVREVSILLNCSVRSVYYNIEAGTIKATNLGQRITRIKRSDIDFLFEQPTPEEPHQKETYFDTSEYYTLAEIIEKYKLSYTSLKTLLKINDIPKIQKGWFTYVPKGQINRILNIS